LFLSRLIVDKKSYSAITSAAGAGTSSTGGVVSTGTDVATGAGEVGAGVAGFVVGFFAAAFFSGESTIVIFRPSSLAMVSTRAN
jgi:hypothetical protein